MDESISRAAKDLVQKMIADVFQSSLAQWYGLADTRIIASKPSAVPIITVQERLLDRVFELDNHTLMHLEFQSTREPNLYRFLGYAVALTLQYQQPVRTVVIYLCKPAVDIPQRLDLGSLDYAVTNIYIGDKEGPAVWDRLQALSPMAWSELDVMDLAFFPFMDDPRSQSERALAATQLAGTIVGEQGRLAAALIIGLTSSLVGPEVLKSMKEVIRVNDLITEIEREAIERGLERGWEKGLVEGRTKGLAEGRVEGRTKGLAEGRVEGRTKGLAEGRVEGHLAALHEVIVARFGEVSPTTMTLLKSLTESQLTMVARKLATVESLEVFVQFLNEMG